FWPGSRARKRRPGGGGAVHCALGLGQRGSRGWTGAPAVGLLAVAGSVRLGGRLGADLLGLSLGLRALVAQGDELEGGAVWHLLRLAVRELDAAAAAAERSVGRGDGEGLGAGHRLSVGWMA